MVGVVCAAFAVAGCSGPSTSRSRRSGGGGHDTPRVAVAYFLDHYELGDGRVDRRDQGGDTVSEGQGYALLAAVAVGNRSKFAAAWSWEQQNLELPTGLFAWHWQHGRVVGKQPAADADVDTAWALALAGRRFGDHSYTRAAARIAAAVLAKEVAPENGHPALAAGPWAVTASPIVSPSYDVPTGFGVLAGLPGASAEWSAVAADAQLEMTQLLSGGLLPPDWAILTTPGPAGPVAHPTANPGDPGSPVVYGFDAVRVPVLLASSCSPRDRSLAASLWPILRREVPSGKLVGLDLGGAPQGSVSTNPIGLVGAAGAAAAAGRRRTAEDLLDRAEAANGRHPTYYASAWIALGRLMLQTTDLGGCGNL